MSDSIDAAALLFWVSWLVLFYLAWPRLVSIGHRALRRRSLGKPVKLTVPPLQSKWDWIVERGLQWATLFFFGLSVLELLFRRPQLERLSLPLFAVCLGLAILVRWWRNHFRPSLEKSEIVFVHVMDNTALGMGLLKVQDLLQRLRETAAELNRKGRAYKEIAEQLLEFVESVRVFLIGIRLEPFDSPVLRQAQPLFIRMETLVDCFELLARLSDEVELRKASAAAIEALSSAKNEFKALQAVQSSKLVDQVNILIAVLRRLYKPTL